MKTCFNTAYFINDTDPEPFFKTASEAGFDGIDLGLDIYMPGNKIQEGDFASSLYAKDINQIFDYFTPHKKAAQKYGVAVLQTHAPFQTYVDERDDINDKCIEMLDKVFAVTAFFDCPYCVVHPLNLAYTKGRAYEWEKNIDFYTKLIPSAKKHGVTVLLENMFSSVNRVVSEAVCSDFTVAAQYIDELNKTAGFECFGFCYDVGHATLLGKDQRSSLVILGNRLKALHIHDNDNIQDHHAMPYTYARNWGYSTVTNWEGFLQGLIDIGYRGALDFETSSGLRLVPKEVFPAALAYVNAVGRYFSDRIEGKIIIQ